MDTTWCIVNSIVIFIRLCWHTWNRIPLLSLFTDTYVIAHILNIAIFFFQAVQTRFANLLDDRGALLAAVSCPKFKLRWLRDADRREQVKQLLQDECCTIAPPPQSSASVANAPVHQGEVDFFDFEAEPEETYSAEKEVMMYMSSSNDLQVLHQFVNTKRIFLKYNTPTPSSAPVERLFSLGGLVLTPRRNRLSDQRFEKLLLMRYNHWFTGPSPQFLA